MRPTPSHMGMGLVWHGNGTDLGVDVFQALHCLSEQSPDRVGAGDQLSRVYQLTEGLVLTVLHLYSITHTHTHTHTHTLWDTI